MASRYKTVTRASRSRGAEIQITEEVFKAVAGNNESSKEVIRLLPDRAGDKIPITGKVVKAAAGNLRNGKQIMTFLLDRAGDRPPTERVANLKSTDFGFLVHVLWSFLSDSNFTIFRGCYNTVRRDVLLAISLKNFSAYLLKNKHQSRSWNLFYNMAPPGRRLGSADGLHPCVLRSRTKSRFG